MQADKLKRMQANVCKLTNQNGCEQESIMPRDYEHLLAISPMSSCRT